MERREVEWQNQLIDCRIKIQGRIREFITTFGNKLIQGNPSLPFPMMATY